MRKIYLLASKKFEYFEGETYSLDQGDNIYYVFTKKDSAIKRLRELEKISNESSFNEQIENVAWMKNHCKNIFEVVSSYGIYSNAYINERYRYGRIFYVFERELETR